MSTVLDDKVGQLHLIGIPRSEDMFITFLSVVKASAERYTFFEVMKL